MKRMLAAESPDAYVQALSDWREPLVRRLRAAATANAKLTEAIKWGHLVYSCNGPALLIRAEDTRVLFGFWRGKRLRDIEPRLKASGKYEMATLVLREGDAVGDAIARRLIREAIKLNRSLGDPTDI